MSELDIVPDSRLEYGPDLICTLDGKAFTGIAYEESPVLGRSEITYHYGVQEGAARDWYPSGALKGESHYVQGVLHGMSNEYDEHGRLSVESRHEYGILVSARRYDQDGIVRDSKEIDLNGNTGRQLEELRAQFNWDS
jgi:hypothetical protein